MFIDSAWIHPDDTDEPTLLFLLQFAEAQKLCNLHQPQGDEVEIHRIVQNLVRNKAMSARVRNKALDIVHEANLASRLPRSHSETLPDVPNDEDSFDVVDTWLEQLQIEEDPDVSKNIVHSLEQTAIQSPYETHAQPIIIGLEALILRDEHSEGILETLVTSTQALINITLHSSSAKASFNALLKVASIECKSTEARIEALRFLFRLRADSDGVLYIQNYADSEYIAAALCRTRESADSFSFSETVEPRRKSGSTTSLSIQSSSTTSGWMYPDTEVFDKSEQFSHIILTTGYQDGSHAVLDMGSWLITMAECLQRDQDWETYSYLIVHAGSQLANTTLFSQARIGFWRQL